MELIPGKQLSEEILSKLSNLIAESQQKPKLAIIQIGEEQPSNVYISLKKSVGDQIGIIIDVFKFNIGDFNAVRSKILELNSDKSTHGIILQLPTPGTELIPLVNSILPSKDVDGLSVMTLGSIWQNSDNIILGATPKAIIYALEYVAKKNEMTFNNFLIGKNVLIINHNILIGKPLAGMLVNKDCTVTLANSKTVNLSTLINQADIIISATGSRIITKENSNYLREGVVIIDSGYAMIDNKAKGDVDLSAVTEKASFITPVPGGIGPLGVAMLMQNTYDAFISFL